MFSNKKEIEWINQKAKIEEDIIEKHGQKILRDMNDVERRVGLSYKEKLFELKRCMRYCSATCIVDEFYSVQLEEWVNRIAKKELLSDRMIKTICMEAKKIFPLMRKMSKEDYEVRKITIEIAKKKYKEKWWDSDNPEEIFLGQIQEDVLIMDFSKFQKATEEALGRSVWTHEFAQPKELLDEYLKLKPNATMNDVIKKLDKYGKQILLIQEDE